MVLVLTLAGGSGAHAFTLKPGDILVAEDGNQNVVKIDPETGAQSSLGKFAGVHDLELSPDGILYVLEHVRRVTKLNILTGERTELTHLGLMGTDEQDTFVAGLTLGSSGDVFVTVYTAPYTGIIRINPVTGQQTLLASGGFINGPIGIAPAANGKLVVANIYGASLIEVDPIDGGQRLLASGLLGSSPWGLAIASDGTIYVGKDTPGTGNSIQQVNPQTGAHAVLISGGNLLEPRGIALDLQGRIISAQSNGKIVRIDPVAKTQIVVASGGFLQAPLALRVSRINIPSTPPELIIAPSVTISWPLANGNSTLQISVTLGPDAVWSSIDVPLLVRGSNITATVEGSLHARFFRLAR